jgi:hypothetical protein
VAETKTKAECGRLGGLETVRRHGREHMARIGKVGFAKVATYARGGRKAALGRLVAKGRIQAPWAELTADQEKALYQEVGLDE